MTDFEVHALSLTEIDRATKTIVEAFETDPMMLWLFGGDEGYKKYASFAIHSWVKWTILYGLAISTKNYEAVALRKKPGKLNFSFCGMLRSGMFSYYRVLGKEIMHRLITLGKFIESEQRSNMKNQKFWYCWMIAAKPENRGQGYGRALMNYTFNLANQEKLPCYLETATLNNVAIHKNKGFKLYSESFIPSTGINLNIS